MKILKAATFCLACLLIFLLAAVASGDLRAKYSLVPKLRADYAYMYASNLRDYSFWQYNQASPEQGRKALLQYVALLQRIRNEGIRYPANPLHRDLGLAYLRLYRLESTAGNSKAADDYMKAAQKEWSALGWKEGDVSTEALAGLIKTRELNEAKLYDNTRLQVTKPPEKLEKSKRAPDE